MQSVLAAPGRAGPGASKDHGPHHIAAENQQNASAAAAGNVRDLLRADSSPVCSLPLYDWDPHIKRFCFLILFSRYHMIDFKKSILVLLSYQLEDKEEDIQFWQFSILAIPSHGSSQTCCNGIICIYVLTSGAIIPLKEAGTDCFQSTNILLKYLNLGRITV